MIINVLVIIILILIVAYFLSEEFQKWVDDLWNDSKDIINKNEKVRNEYNEKQKEKLRQLELQEQKLKDLKQEKENEETTQEFLNQYSKLEDEIERLKSQIEYNKLDAFETDLLELETQINTLELEREECSAFQNEYTKTVTQSSGNCLTTCNEYDPITKKKIEKENGICKVGNECYYSHHSWSDLHQACKYDYKLHVKATQGECNLIIDDVSYHITNSEIKIPLVVFRGGVYNDDQTKWGFTYTIEPITTNKLSNDLCLIKNGLEMKKLTQTHLRSTIMMSRENWDETTHIEWTIQHQP